MQITGRRIGALGAIVVALTALPVDAQIVELMSKADPGALPDTPGGHSTPYGISADGRYVVFESDGSTTNLIPGQIDTNGTADIFLYDRVTGTITLVSHTPGAPSTTGNFGATFASISADGAFVLFLSESTDIVAGMVDANGATDAFLFERATGTITLVSHRAGAPLTTADAASDPFLFPPPLASRLSADGSYAVFVSSATDLVAGQIDANGGNDVFVFERATGNISLVSHVPASVTTASDGYSYSPRISADGAYVAFTSRGLDLIPGQVDFTIDDVFLYQRASGLVTLVSHIPASAVTTPDGDSASAQISADGSWVVFISFANNLVAGQVDNNSGEDVFLFERATGAVTLVSHVPASTTVTGNDYSGFFAFPHGLAISPGGDYVALLSRANDLITGQVDGNFENDVFRYERAGGTLELISSIPGSSTDTSLFESIELSMSDDGERIAFASAGDDLVTGQVDTNGANDVFLRDRGSGTTTMVSHTFGAATTAGDNNSPKALISADGAYTTYESSASDLVGGLADLNNRFDVFLHETATGINDIATRADVGAPTASSNGGSSTDALRDAMSADGRYTVFVSGGTNLVPGQVDTNNASDLFLYDRVTQSVTLVSHAAGAPNVAADRFSDLANVSDDGGWVVFRSGAMNLVPGQIEGNASSDIFLFERATGNVTLVSHIPGSPITTGNSSSGLASISADGSWVAFPSFANDLIATDINGLGDVFLFERATGNVSLVSHIPGAPGTPGNAASSDPRISLDSNWVAFSSRATNLVAGQVDGNGGDDAFVLHRPTGVVSLVSRAAGTVTTTGNGVSIRPQVSFDGSYVAFRSAATNVVVGQVDINGVHDLFLFDTGLAMTNIITHQPGAPLVTVNNASLAFSISNDASYIAFSSRGSDVVPAQVPVGGDDIFVYERLTGLNSIVSRQAGTPATEGNMLSDTPVISGDGNWIVFRSWATDLVLGQIDTNNSGDVFLHDRVAQTTHVVSLKAATTATTGSLFADGAVLGGSGDYVAFRSPANDLVSNDFNGNNDAFLYIRTTQASDLMVTKDDGQSTAVPGDPISYLITVTNNGPTALTSLYLNDTVPSEILTPIYTPSAGTYNDVSDLWSGISLPPAGSITMTLSGTIDPAARGTLVNSVTVTPPPPIVNPLPANNTAIDSDVLAPETDLEIVKTDSPDPVDSGSTLTYTLTVTNHGPSEATNIVVTDALPPVTFVSAVPGAPTCNYLAGQVTCDMGSLPPTWSTIITIDVIANFAGLSNAAYVTSDETDPDPSNNIDSEGTVVNIPSDAVRFFTAKATSGQNRLEWINPAPVDYLATHIVVNTTGFPAHETDGTVIVNGGTAGAHVVFDHTGLTDTTTYYYGAFVERVAGFSAGKFTTGRPFDDSGRVKWAFTTGAASMAPPSLAVYIASNDRVLYSVTPGPSGGDWPAGWIPFEAPQPSQARPPVVPVTVGTANKVVFLGAQDGHVYAVDADSGVIAWPSPMLGDRVQAAPAGMFTAYGGTHDLILVGSRNSATDNLFYGLHLADGTVAWSFDNLAGSGGIGIISGGAAVDYANDRVYFASRARGGGSSSTVWCLDFDDVSANLRWERDIGDVDGSPILIGGKVYVGTNTSEVHALDADDGSNLWSAPYPASDGPIKGFIWPKWNDNELFFSTTNNVWSIDDDGGSASLNWKEASIPSPSTPLFFQGLDLLFVGSSDGRLHQLDVSGGSPVIDAVVLGDGGGAGGSPSLDGSRYTVYISTDAGIVYAVAIPLP